MRLPNQSADAGDDSGVTRRARGAGARPGVLKVAVVDDDPNVGDLVERKLRRLSEFQFVAGFLSAEAALKGLCNEVPDILMVDIALGPQSGIDLMRRLAEKWPEVCPVVISGGESPNQVVQAFEAGARGYLLKPINLAELPAQLQRLRQGETVLHPRIADFLVGYFNRQGLVSVAMNSLTAREREIMRLAARAECEKEMAAELQISGATLKSHFQSVFKKLGVTSKAQALNKLRGSAD